MKGQGFFFTPIYACMHVNSIGFIVYNFQVPKYLNYHQTNWELTKGLGLDMNEYASSWVWLWNFMHLPPTYWQLTLNKSLGRSSYKVSQRDSESVLITLSSQLEKYVESPFPLSHSGGIHSQGAYSIQDDRPFPTSFHTLGSSEHIPKHHLMDSWQLIVDLSHPPGFRAFLNISVVSMQYVTIDDAINQVIKLGPGTLLATADIKVPFIYCLFTQQIGINSRWQGKVLSTYSRYLPTIWLRLTICSKAF